MVACIVRVTRSTKSGLIQALSGALSLKQIVFSNEKNKNGFITSINRYFCMTIELQ